MKVSISAYLKVCASLANNERKAIESERAWEPSSQLLLERNRFVRPKGSSAVEPEAYATTIASHNSRHQIGVAVLAWR